MSVVEMHPAVHPSFPASDTRPSLKTAYAPGLYAESRHSSKENKTPPLPDVERSPGSSRSYEEVASIHSGPYQLSPVVAGKKRSADGELKEGQDVSDPNKMAKLGHSRNVSAVSNASNATVTELGQQLKTRLTYAMVKVQNGWQNRSLDEVESLASASPRSTTFNHYSSNQYLLSPRVAMTATLNREDSDSSSGSVVRPAPALMSPPPARKGLAPPANIVAKPGQQRRRATPNMSVHTAMKPPSPTRPAVKHRTPSQNAAMEADAVETLLFMASPNHSNNSNNHRSQFSPITSAPSIVHPSQTSPLRNTFSAPTSPRRVTFTDHVYNHRSAKKTAIIDAILEKLDEDGSAELDEALKLMDRHHATKVAG